MNLLIHIITTILPDIYSRFTIRAILDGNPETSDVPMTLLFCLPKRHNHAVRTADPPLSNALNVGVLGCRGICHLQLRQLFKEGDQPLPPPERAHHHHRRLHDASRLHQAAGEFVLSCKGSLKKPLLVGDCRLGVPHHNTDHRTSPAPLIHHREIRAPDICQPPRGLL